MYVLPEVTEDDRLLATRSAGIKDKRELAIAAHRANRTLNRRIVHPERIAKRKRPAQFDGNEDFIPMDVDDEQASKRRRVRSLSRVRSMSRARSIPARDRSIMGLRDGEAVERTERGKRLAQRQLNLFAKRGEADREITVAKPKHLFSGKRKSGTHDRR